MDSRSVGVIIILCLPILAVDIDVLISGDNIGIRSCSRAPASKARASMNDSMLCPTL